MHQCALRASFPLIIGNIRSVTPKQRLLFRPKSRFLYIRAKLIYRSRRHHDVPSAPNGIQRCFYIHRAICQIIINHIKPNIPERLFHSVPIGPLHNNTFHPAAEGIRRPPPCCNCYLMSVLQQSIHQMDAEKTRSSKNQYFHWFPSPSRLFSSHSQNSSAGRGLE